MPIVRFSGRIFPYGGVSLTIADHPQINWHDSTNNLDVSYRIHIRNSVITVDCETDRFDESLVTPIFLRAFDLSRAAVDLTAFASGYGFIVVFETITYPNNVTTPFGAHDPSLSPLCTAFQIGVKPISGVSDFHKILMIVSTDWRIFRALRLLIEAITYPHESATHCARSIEGLRHIIAPNEQPKQSWPKLRNALNISEDYLKMITDISTGPRHGDPTHIPGPIIREITHRSWKIMDRFFEYKKRDGGPLPLAEFPLLTA